MDDGEAQGAVVALRAVVGLVAGVASAEFPTPERRELIAALDSAIAALTASRGDLLLAERDAGRWQGAGDPTFESWRGRTSRTGRRRAAAQVRQAEAASAMPALRAAVVGGAVTLDHLDVVARLSAGATASVRSALTSEEGQRELVGLARHTDVEAFARSAARWAARLDAAGLERGHQAERAARYLHVVDAPDGTRITGRLDRMAGHRLRLALEAVSPRPAMDDERTSEQRRADALDVLAQKVLGLAETGSGAAVRPHVSLLVPAETWAALRGSRRRGGESDSGRAEAPRGTVEGAAAVEPATLEDGTPVPLSELARSLCDCELTRVVLDADSVPLDLGRTQRTYTGAQRRAVIARDRACGWPGCGAHARWCEVHHIRWWDRDFGPTSVENGVLLCSFHHHEVHRRDLTITRHRPPPERHPGDPATITYTFTDPTGHALPLERDDARARDASTPRRLTPPSAEEPPSDRPPGRPCEITDRDLERVTDPVTGMSLPRFLLTG